jgi:hypothetical protein
MSTVAKSFRDVQPRAKRSASWQEVPMPSLPSTGTLTLPAGFRVRVELHVEEPEQKALATPMRVKAQPAPKPRANVHVVRSESSARSASTTLAELLAQLGRAMPGFTVLGEGAFQFDDGAIGATALVRYEPIAGVRLVQRHTHRLDDGVLTHLTASASELDQAKIDALLTPLMQSFRLG